MIAMGVWCRLYGWFAWVVALVHDMLSGLLVGFLVNLEVGFCCCCFGLFCFVSPGFLVGMFVAGCFVDL